MGKETFSRAAYTGATKSFASSEGPATMRAEQQAKKTGKLHPLVDPAGYGTIRPSRPRFEQQPNGTWLMTVGTPVPVETRVDTTASMRNNVDVALSVLPNAYEFSSQMLPGCDIQIATGIFGDVSDNFVLCRPQFEMLAERIVEQLTLMVPERDGGDFEEDPHYGLFGGAYLTDAYISKIGLKGYDFTVSDAPARDRLDPKQLRRIFGDDVFEKVAENGHQISQKDLPTTREVVQDLLRRAHAFFLQVGSHSETTNFWTRVFGKNRVVMLPSTELLPQVQATIIGLTEGTLSLLEVEKFLTKNNVSESDAARIAESVANIPIGAQCALPNYGKRPRAGDIFREKTDLWPMDPSELPTAGTPDTTGESPNWL